MTWRGPALAALMAASLLLAGCIQYDASKVPEDKLHGSTGNGWILDRREPVDGPRSENLGLLKSRTLVYLDPGESGSQGNGGYPASLSVISFKVAFTTPDRQEITERARRLVEEEATARGVDLDKPPDEGQRTVASQDRAQYFLYDGTVTDDSSLFSREADVKVVGIVWNCEADGGNTVVAVGLAQVNDRQGGVLEDPDDTNWREIWEDADMAASGRDGGLAVHITCG